MIQVSKKEALALKKMKREVIRTKRRYWAVETKGLMTRLKLINE